MGQRALIPVSVAINGVGVRSETLLAEGGPYALVLSSVLPDYAVDLHSTYLGHPDTTTRVSHLLLAPDLVESEAVERGVGSIPVAVARRRCLYDHLQHLQDCLGRCGYTRVQMSLGDDALRTADLWRVAQ